MNHSNFPALRLSAFLAGLLLTALPVMLLAQAAPPPPGQQEVKGQEEILTLNPFVVGEEAQRGWIATETLAGSRLRTNLKDVPNQIETLTKEFMSDLGMNSLQQALIYTANTENEQEYVELATGNQVINPEVPGRIRGMKSTGSQAGAFSRNFFGTNLKSDNFNIDRATVASGPNPVLFSLGNPAGLLDSTTARATTQRNQYGFKLQYDSENSKRGTFDANVVAVPNKLALRLMGLSQRQYAAKKPNLDRDERLYGTLTWTPFKNTSISVQGESVHRHFNPPHRNNAYDNVSLWLFANQIPGSGYTAPSPAYNNSVAQTVPASNVIFSTAPIAPVLITDGSVSLRNWRQSATVKKPSQLPGVDPVFDAAIDYTINDPNIFPFDVNLIGTARAPVTGGTIKSIFVNQKIRENIFLELAYNYEDTYNHRLAAGGGGGGANNILAVDPNQFLPGTTTPNPNFGRFYFQEANRIDLKYDTIEQWRASLSYELDFEKRFAKGWHKWLGRHRFSGVYEESKTEHRAQAFFRRILDDPFIPGLTLTPKTTASWAVNATRSVLFRQYLDRPFSGARAAGPMKGDWTLVDGNNRPFNLYLFDTGMTAANGMRLGGNNVVQNDRSENAGTVFAWQGSFLRDRDQESRLIFTFGYRKDRVRAALPDTESITRDFSGFFPVLWDARFEPYGPAESGINRSHGVVARPLKWLSLFYQHSTTFNVHVSDLDPFGDVVPGASGEGDDYGIRLDLWKNKLSLRVNRYEATLGPGKATTSIQVYVGTLNTLETRVRELNPGTQTINVTEGSKKGFGALAQANYAIYSDQRSKGYEVELNFSPTRNWNLRLNGSKSDAIESNMGLPWFNWVALRLPVWQNLVASNGEVDAANKAVTWNTALISAADPNSMTLAQYHTSAVEGQALAFMKAIDGRANVGARSARVNLITKYAFPAESRLLKGFNVGGAMRWRDRPNIGYATAKAPTGTTILDVSRPYLGPRELYFDAFLGYQGRMKRFGDVRYLFQLNVRNVLNKDDPIPIVAVSTGAIAKMAIVEPRTIVMTFGVDF